VEPSGAISPLVSNRAFFNTLPKGAGSTISDLGGGHYRLQVYADHSGWSGLVLLTGNGGFPTSLLDGKAGSRPPDWAQRFAADAAKNHWQSEMVWYNIVKPA
jgi:serine/threonine-protein kinase